MGIFEKPVVRLIFQMFQTNEKSRGSGLDIPFFSVCKPQRLIDKYWKIRQNVE